MKNWLIDQLMYIFIFAIFLIVSSFFVYLAARFIMGPIVFHHT